MAVPLAADYPFLEVLWSTLIFMAFLLWIWLAITCFADIFRRHDMGGFLKAIWVAAIIVIPYFGVLIYLIAYHGGIAERNVKDVKASQDAFDAVSKTFPDMNASKNKRWVTVSGHAQQPSLVTVDAVVQVAKTIHPEAF